MEEKKDGFFERFFGISKNGSTMKIEVLAGVTTFITIAYILILNPQILADPYVIMGDAAMAGKISNGVFIGTCIGAFIGTILCALYAKVPFAQAPGMGLNAFLHTRSCWGWDTATMKRLSLCLSPVSSSS